MKAHHVQALQHIASLGGIDTFVALPTRELGKSLGLSQQAASRRILELVDLGLVQRDLASRQQRVRLTAKGVEALRSEYAVYQKLFEVGRTLRIEGLVMSGSGEGSWYMRQKGYKDQFRARLGFEPFEGTLNLRLSSAELPKLDILGSEPGIGIDGFTADGRTYGGAKCFPAVLKGRACNVILPIRTHHTETIEVIAEDYLRGAIGLKDGDRVELSVAL